MTETARNTWQIVYGIHPIVELLKAKRRRLHTVYTTRPEPKGWKSIVPLLPKGTQINYVTRDRLNTMAGTTDHQGVVAHAAPFVYQKTVIDTTTYPFLLLLDGIQDARNLGAIMRSAYCTQISGVIITQKNSAPMTAAAIKASAGLAEYVPVMSVPTAKYAFQLLKKEGYNLYLAVLDKAVSATEVAYQSPLCVVIGNEEVGIDKEMHSLGTPITLPQKRADISYNASVAAGILLFTIAVQQKRI